MKHGIFNHIVRANNEIILQIIILIKNMNDSASLEIICNKTTAS